VKKEGWEGLGNAVFIAKKDFVLSGEQLQPIILEM